MSREHKVCVRFAGALVCVFLVILFVATLLYFIVVFAQTPACCLLLLFFFSDRIYCTHRFPWGHT